MAGVLSVTVLSSAGVEEAQEFQTAARTESCFCLSLPKNKRSFVFANFSFEVLSGRTQRRLGAEIS